MQSLAPIQAQLNLINLQLIQQPVFSRGAGLPVDDPGYTEETRQLEQIGQRLAILIRELKNRTHFLLAQERGLWNVPRDQRYSQKNSIDQRREDTGVLLRTAAEVQKRLEDLIRKSGLLSSGEVAKGLGEIITKLYEQSHHVEVTGLSTPEYKPLLPGQLNASPEAATIAVFVALQALLRLRKRKASTTAT
jgi:hypothetical protein